MISKALSTSQKRAALHTVVPDLAEFCQQLFPLLVAHSDDFGREQGDIFTVKHAVDPTSPRPLSDFQLALQALHDVGLIIWYQADGRMFVKINNFDAHQPGLHKRTAPHFPEPPGSSRESSEIPSEEKGIEQKGTSISPTAKDVVDLWNEVVTSPIPKVTKLTTDRETKINARLQSYPDLNTWRTVIVWINGQEWCRAAGRGDHPNWTATLDWLVRNDGNVQRQLERASVMPSKPAPGQATRDEAHLRYDRPFGATS